MTLQIAYLSHKDRPLRLYVIATLLYYRSCSLSVTIVHNGVGRLRYDIPESSLELLLENRFTVPHYLLSLLVLLEDECRN